MGKAKVRIIGEKIEIDKLNLSKLTTDCHGVSYYSDELEQLLHDVVIAYSKVDIFDLYYDDGKDIQKIWVLGGKLNPKLAVAAIDYK